MIQIRCKACKRAHRPGVAQIAKCKDKIALRSGARPDGRSLRHLRSSIPVMTSAGSRLLPVPLAGRVVPLAHDFHAQERTTAQSMRRLLGGTC